MTENVAQGTARKNLLVVAAVLVGLTAWNLYRHRIVRAEVSGGLALVLCIVVLCSHSWTERINRGWMALAAALGYVNSRILLSLLYYAVLTPFGFFLRLVGHDPMHRRGGKQDSYWIPRQAARQTKSGFEHLF